MPGGDFKRRIGHGPGQLPELFLQLLAHAFDRRADRGDMRRATLDWRKRQRRVAKAERHLLQWQAHGSGGDLAHHGVGAGANVAGRAAHDEPSVGVQHRSRARQHLQRIPGAGGHAPADQFVALLHSARRGRTAGPAETLGALPIAGAQFLAGVGQVPGRVALGVVFQPQRQRVHAKGIRQFVHRHFQRMHTVRRTGRAHIKRAVLVERDQLVVQPHVVALVELA